MSIDFGNWAFRNNKLVYFLIAVLVIGGAYSAYDMSKLEDPELKVKLAMVAATYPGASANEVELQVTDPLEKSLLAIGDVKNVTSYSYDDFCVLEVELNSTVPDADVEQCWDMLRRKVGDTAASLPSGVSVSVQDDFGLVYGMFYAITGDGFSDKELDDYAELLKREIGNIDGVARVNLYGKKAECINVSLTAEKMAALGVSPAEILSTLNGQNETTYSGYYDNGDRRVKVTVGDKFRTPEQIGELIIQGHEDDQLRLKDIATVESGYETPQRNSMEYNGERAIGMVIAAGSGTDIVKVGKQVEKRLKQLGSERLPVGIECHKVFFQPDEVTSSLTTFAINLIESVLIVIAILMITMGFRSGLMIGVSLVVIVIGSFLFLGFMDGTMQRVSLASFIFAMGMLVDNAIVITDGILVGLKTGKPRREAMTEIGRKTAMPLLGATVIAILSFLPVLLSPDSAGVYVRDLFIVLAVSLLLSWILALVHVPLMADKMLKGAKYEKADTEKSMYDGWLYRFMRKALTYSIKHKFASIVIALALIGSAFWGYKYMRQGFFPDMTYSQLYMEYKLPEGTSPSRVEADLKEIREWLQTQPEIKDVTTSLGGTPARYNLVRSIATPSLSYGELIIDFTDPKTLEKSVDRLQEQLTAMYPDAYVKLKRYNIMYKKYPIELVFTGPDPAVLRHLADSAESIMNSMPEICLITTDREPDVPVLDVTYNQPAARSAGVSRSDVSMWMLMANGGLPVSTFYDGNRRNTIYIKCLDNDGNAMDNLENVPIMQTIPDVGGALTDENMLKMRNGTLAKSDLIESMLGTKPVKQVSDGIDIEWENPVVPRYNGQRAQKVMCSPVPGVETENARKALEANLEQIKMPEGYSLIWQGEKGASDQTMKYLFANVPIAVILIIAILILLFGDYRKPLIILCCIPLLGVGIVGAMLISGKTFTFCAIVGALGLVGMMMKNCIVLMDEINDQIASGKDPAEALISSSETRLRAVMMASMTTILGMIPLISDAMFGSMAVTIMGGLLFSTIATLFFVPLLYAVFFKIKM